MIIKVVLVSLYKLCNLYNVQLVTDEGLRLVSLKMKEEIKTIKEHRMFGRVFVGSVANCVSYFCYE